MAKRTPKGQVAKLTKELDKVEKKLFDLSIITAKTKKTDNLFWARMRAKTKKLYEEARIIYAAWNELNIPFFYNKNIRKQIKRIKDLSFTIPNPTNYKQFKNKNINKQTIKTILNDSISSFVIGADSGEKKLNRLYGLTQQLNITETTLNKGIEEGFKERASVYGARKRIQEDLLRDALEKKYITVIDKNGKPINYKITTYAELVARTKLIQAQSDGTVNLAISTGSDLVQVSSHNTKTEYDAQFEGKIYSLSGKNSNFPAVIDLPPFHPNCRHTITVVFEEALEINRTLEKLSDFSKGKINIHPTRTAHIPINKRKGLK